MRGQMKGSDREGEREEGRREMNIISSRLRSVSAPAAEERD